MEEISLGGKENDFSSLANESAIQEPEPEMQMDFPEPDIQQIVEFSEERRRLIKQCRDYFMTFEHKLAEMNMYRQQLDILTEEQLAELLQEIKLTVSHKNSQALCIKGGQMAVHTLEFVLSSYTPIKAGGLGSICATEEFNDCLLELSLENQSYLYTTPTKRMGGIIAMAIMGLHSRNSQIEAVKNQAEYKNFEADLNEPVTEDFQGQFGDL
jgi:hypothetical protein